VGRGEGKNPVSRKDLGGGESEDVDSSIVLPNMKLSGRPGFLSMAVGRGKEGRGKKVPCGRDNRAK